MAQVRSVLSRRQLVEFPGRLSIHLLHYLHPVPGTHPLQQAAAGGISFTNSVLPPGAFSLFGMLLGRGTDSILFFGAQDEIDFNRDLCAWSFIWKPGGPQLIYSSYMKGILLELLPVEKLRSKKSRKLFAEGESKCAGGSRMKLLKNILSPVGNFTFPNTEVTWGIE